MRSRGKKQTLKPRPQVKKKRRRLNPRPILWLLLVINIMVGLAISPATAITKVQIEGAPQTDVPRLTEILQSVKNKPWVKLDETAVEDLVLSRGEVSAARFGGNIFGRGQLTLAYEEPVGLLLGTQKLVLTASGKLIPVASKHKDLPLVNPPVEVLRPTIGLSSPWQGKRVAEVCQYLKRIPGGKQGLVTVDSAGKVSLKLGTSGRVILGAPEELQEKFTKLGEILEERPDLFSKGYEVNLMTPTKPVMRPI